jgi:hypothetical protein
VHVPRRLRAEPSPERLCPVLPFHELTIRMPAVDADLWTDPVGLVHHIWSKAPAPAERALRARLAGWATTASAPATPCF